MKSVYPVVAFLFAVVAITFAGCGSRADSLASEYIDLRKKAASDPANAAQYKERAKQIDKELKAEIDKMSPEEKVEFMKKWTAKMMESAFEEAFKNMPSGKFPGSAPTFP